ncbi:hypothetical protein HUE87_05805 [Candidatus Sulfurimonas marisnigri]|uniref:Uncharacterized protein n=1 Tax=Candidatus Sulfurimonas marisnigri TaxID=2740405 RepID=A0A7S7RRJ1_9BACT|nr:hypothetical protein [Candidatus Sulfurimonas marisnigri]QOY55738.1 hypothetical protein HUE87_05805 [Candidatus Sulfurimonas marisnigri]
MKNIASELNTYLKTNLPKPSIDFKWDDLDNENFFLYLNKNYPKNFLSNSENLLNIKRAFKEYFEPIGYPLLKLTENTIRIKVFEYKTEPKDSINLDAIINIIESYEDLIEYDYKGIEGLISIPEDVKNKIYSFVRNINNEDINKKELIRFAVRHAFELEESDIIIIRSNQIIIKLLDGFLIEEVADNQKNTVANRYNGIDEDKLKSFNDEIFSQQDNKDFFYFTAEEFVDTYFLVKNIDNIAYEKNAFSLIQSIIIEQLTNLFDNNNEFFKGFAGYIFRIHFKEVFGYIADIILEEVGSSNKNMIEFLKYYSLDVVVLDGIKYKVPRMEAENGMRWNITSIMSIVRVYIKAKISIDNIYEKVNDLNNDISGLYIGGISPLEYNNGLKREIDKLSQEANYDTKKLDSYIDTLSSSKDENERKTLKNDIVSIKRNLLHQKEQKAVLSSKLIDSSVVANYADIKREIDSLKREENRDKKILIQNQDSYMSIQNALVKALTSKKILLGKVK